MRKNRIVVILPQRMVVRKSRKVEIVAQRLVREKEWNSCDCISEGSSEKV